MSLGHGAGIVRSGLVLYLDAANKKSYPGTGTVWTDLSDNGNNGTLVNSVGYNSANKGTMIFDGTNDYINTGYFVPNINYTITTYFNFTGSLTSQFNRGVFSTFSVGNYNGIYFGTSGQLSTVSSNMWIWTNGNQRYDIPYLFETNRWYQVAFVVTTNTINIYINSTLLSQVNTTTTHSDVLNIGRTRFDSNYWVGNISQVSIYNRALTATEIRQNFNTHRGRYDI